MKTVTSIAAVLLLIPAVGSGSLSVPRSLAELEQTANLIVAGSASDGVPSGEVGYFRLQISRVVKGDQSLAGSVIAVTWNRGTRQFRTSH